MYFCFRKRGDRDVKNSRNIFEGLFFVFFFERRDEKKEVFFEKVLVFCVAFLLDGTHRVLGEVGIGHLTARVEVYPGIHDWH